MKTFQEYLAESRGDFNQKIKDEMAQLKQRMSHLNGLLNRSHNSPFGPNVDAPKPLTGYARDQMVRKAQYNQQKKNPKPTVPGSEDNRPGPWTIVNFDGYYYNQVYGKNGAIEFPTKKAAELFARTNDDYTVVHEDDMDEYNND